MNQNFLIRAGQRLERLSYFLEPFLISRREQYARPRAHVMLCNHAPEALIRPGNDRAATDKVVVRTVHADSHRVARFRPSRYHVLSSRNESSARPTTCPTKTNSDRSPRDVASRPENPAGRDRDTRSPRWR